MNTATIPGPAQARPSDEDSIRSLPLWSGRVEIEPLSGGLTNKNYSVRDATGVFVARIGADIPEHGIMRFNEATISLAAAAAGLSPRVIYSGGGVMVLERISGCTYSASDVRQDFERVVSLVRRAHHEIPRFMRGPVLAFNVHHVVRDYLARLGKSETRWRADLPELAIAAARLEAWSAPERVVLTHNDLLPANLIADETRLWLIDWDYAGFGTPMFDLGGLATNCELPVERHGELLELYFGHTDEGLLTQLRVSAVASLLRETLWSMVSEIYSSLDHDFHAYTTANLLKFRHAVTAFAPDLWNNRS